MPKVTQYENVKNYLEEGNKITPIEALNKFGSFRLSAIIFNLRQNGYPIKTCLLYTSPSPRDGLLSRMPSSA